MDHVFFFVGDIWPNLTLCVTGELWPFESIIDLRVWLGWSGASTVRWILQTAEACCFFVFLSTKNWSKSSKVLGFTGQGFIQHIWFFVEATPKTRKQQHGLCNDFLFFFPLVDFPKMVFFFCLRNSGGFWWLFFYGMGRRRIQSCVATCRGPKMPPLMADCYEGKVGFFYQGFYEYIQVVGNLPVFIYVKVLWITSQVVGLWFFSINMYVFGEDLPGRFQVTQSKEVWND